MRRQKIMKKVSCKTRMNNTEPIHFNNQVDYCVGTGRAGLALCKEYYEQLKFVQDIIGFKHIRGHGLFTDDMAIYHEYTDEDGNTHAEYNFTYLDNIMDSYLELNIRPFLELGFMPNKLASGDQAIFYWKGNVTPPKSYEEWCDLVTATLSHLIDRYGYDEVITWPIEVWNEPNLPGFWKGADMEEYFKLFKYSFEAIKKLDKNFKVGGPAICGVRDEEWIQKFMEFCRKNRLDIDFVTRHHYTTEMPERSGHYSFQELSNPEYGKNNLHTTREIIDSFEEYKGLPIHITEFNTSYVPNNPIHDTNKNAAYIAHQLSWLGDDNESYSYWTFGDVFEEQGVPFTPFHGGFGLVANGVIPKPTFWTFAFFKKLQGECIYRGEEAVIVKADDGSIRGVVWNHGTKRTGEMLEFSCEIDVTGANSADPEYSVVSRVVDEDVCNPLKVWHDLGEPSSLSEEQKKILKDAAVPAVESSRVAVSEEGILAVSFVVKEFGVTYFECRPVCGKGDRGYSYERIMQ